MRSHQHHVVIVILMTHVSFMDSSIFFFFLSFDLISLVGYNLGFPGLWLSRLDLVVQQLSSGTGSGSC